MKRKWILVAIAMPLLAAGCGLSDPNNQIDARELTLRTLFVRAVDADSGDGVRVGLSVMPVGLSQYLKTHGGEKAAPVLVELTDTGTCRATWIATPHDTAAFTLTADGYEPFAIPTNLIETVSHTQFRSGLAGPEIVKLKKMARDQAEPWRP